MESNPQVEPVARLESTTSVDSKVETDKKPLHISIRLIGDKGVGKTSLIDRYLNKPKDEQNSDQKERKPKAEEKRTFDSSRGSQSKYVCVTLV